MKKNKKYKIEEYWQNVTEGRCWGCNQENCQDCSCSCHRPTSKRFYKILLDGAIVKSYFKNENEAKNHVETQLNPKWLKNQYRNRIKSKKIEISIKQKEVKQLQKQLKAVK